MREADIIACVELALETDPDPTFGKVCKAVRDEAGWCHIRTAVDFTTLGLMRVGASGHPTAPTARAIHENWKRLRDA